MKGKFPHCSFIHFVQRKMLMIMVEIKKKHCLAATRACKRIIAKRGKGKISPAIKGKKNSSFFLCDCQTYLFVRFAMPCIKSIVSDLFEMFFQDVLDQASNEFHSRNGLDDEFIIFMPVVMKSNIFAIIGINA